jgi:Protein kinase domain
MAPEQARGRAADKRSDVWAFGCVLYEMLTGRRPFDGEDVTDTIAAVMRGEPHWNALPTQTPAAIRRLLRRCLAKDRSRRLADIAAHALSWKTAGMRPPSVRRTSLERIDRVDWRLPSAGGSLHSFLPSSQPGSTSGAQGPSWPRGGWTSSHRRPPIPRLLRCHRMAGSWLLWRPKAVSASGYEHSTRSQRSRSPAPTGQVFRVASHAFRRRRAASRAHRNSNSRDRRPSAERVDCETMHSVDVFALGARDVGVASRPLTAQTGRRRSLAFNNAPTSLTNRPTIWQKRAGPPRRFRTPCAQPEPSARNLNLAAACPGMTVAIAARIRRIRWSGAGGVPCRTNGKPTNGVGKNIATSRRGTARAQTSASTGKTPETNRRSPRADRCAWPGARPPSKIGRFLRRNDFSPARRLELFCLKSRILIIRHHKILLSLVKRVS